MSRFTQLSEKNGNLSPAVKPTYEYVLFPLPLLQEVFKDPQNGFRTLQGMGIYTAAGSFMTTTESALKQAVYCFYKGGLNKSLQHYFDLMVKEGIFEPDYEYTGFTHKNHFDPDVDVEIILEEMGGNHDFMQELSLFHRLRQAQKAFRVSFDIDSILEIANKCEGRYDFSNQPMVSVKRGILAEYQRRKPTMHEKMLFLGYAGIKSIIGNKEFAATTREMILCRMFGTSKPELLENTLKDKRLREVYDKYSRRYQMEKILNELVARSFVSSKLGYNRRTYVSCKLDYDQLSSRIIKEVKEKSINHTIKTNKIKELEMKKKIFRHLNKSTS